MITPGFLGLPMMEGKIALGASSPEKPALTTPEPLSITQTYCSSDICYSEILFKINIINLKRFYPLYLFNRLHSC
jgi:hypothetical protein